jgi:hypothetical protein
MRRKRPERPADAETLRSELERCFLNVQGERVALTAAVLRLEAASGPAGLELVVLRLLRLRRATDSAKALIARGETKVPSRTTMASVSSETVGILR